MAIPSSLNSPVAVAAAGAGTFLSTPLVMTKAVEGAIPWPALKTICVLAYCLSVFSTTRPGRLDSGLEVTGDSDLDPSMGARSLFAPAPWAFAIWGAIFLGELVYITSQFALVREGGALTPLLKKVSVPFIATEILQSLWCAAFRPKYQGMAAMISAALLTAGSITLSRGRLAFGAASSSYSVSNYFTYFLPHSLKSGWLAAATLVGINGRVCMKKSVSTRRVAIVGHASAIAASAIGVYTTLTQNSPVFGGVICWALTAVADSMRARLAREKKEDSKEETVKNGVKTQCVLSVFGALATGFATLKTALNIPSHRGFSEATP